jgi:DNA-binding transcriptional regulator YiaG
MSPDEFKAARATLGLSAREMAIALDMDERWGDRTIRKWESGKSPIFGPVGVAVRYMLKYGVGEE